MSRRLPLRYHRHWTTYHRKAVAQQRGAGRRPGRSYSCLDPARGCLVWGPLIGTTMWTLIVTIVWMLV